MKFYSVSLLHRDQEVQIQHFEDALSTINKNAELSFGRIVLNDDDDELEQVCSELPNGIQFLVDFTWSGTETAKELANDVNIPYIHADISISPYLLFLDSYLDRRNSTDVLIVFDKEAYVDQALYYWLDSTRLRMIISDPITKKTARRIDQIRPIPSSFVLIGTSRNVENLFKQAKQEGLVKLPDRWNLLLTDIPSIPFNRTILMENPVTLLMLKEDYCCSIMQKEVCQCPQNFQLDDQFIYWFSLTLDKIIRRAVEERWDFSGNPQCNASKYPDDTVERFNEILETIIDEEQKILRKRGHTITLNIEGEIEKYYEGDVEIIGNFQNGKLIVTPGKHIKPIKPFYRIGIAHALPWSFKEQDPNTGQYYWTGYCADMSHRIAKVLNFDFEFVEPKSGTFGQKINGTWNGVVGDLARGDTDLAITAIIMTADREEVIDFVPPYYEQTGISIVMRKPVRKTSLFKFMTVLKLEVWLSIVAALIVTGFMVWFLDKYSPYSARNNKQAYTYPCREFTLKESFWFALTSFTPQGGGEAPKALSGRTLVAAYWLFVVLMLATFTANLAAFLTVERMQAPVQSLEQLARQSRINYTVVKNSEIHEYFINMKFAEDTLYRMWKELTLNASTDDTRYRVWDYPIREQYGHILLAINDSNPVKDAAEGFRLVDEHLDADFAFIHDSSEIKYEISRNCNFTEVGEVFAEKPYSVAVQQGSHLQDDLSKVILDLQKDRFFEQLQAKYWNHSAKGNCPSTDDNEGITLESLGGVFIATLFGLALAMITLAGEVIYYKRKGRTNKNEKKPPLDPLKQSLKPPKYDDHPVLDKFNVAKTITIGTTFKPVNIKENTKKDLESVNISHISLYPKARNRITRVD
ncbi:hypothetical protein GWI33_017263 [Rhynchophorus ferrugineus]|uniref:Ionotropic receptor 8a n=1 Tax=Rhynchophorus ferrugineus TaxID=354439 RepID=A0A834M7V6_RHYFE|nr:hypothetical protein GWI33_017263 [Rhynchophorus ferrugineus]